MEVEQAPRRGRPPREKIDMIEQTEKNEAPKATRPGFKPASRLGYLKAPANFTARWVKNDPDNIARKKQEGWVVMKPEDNKGTSFERIDVSDPKETGNHIRYQDMIAMMLPNDIKKDREEYYRNETRHATRAILRESDAQFKQKGVQTYTPKGQQGRIVID